MAAHFGGRGWKRTRDGLELAQDMQPFEWDKESGRAGLYYCFAKFAEAPTWADYTWAEARS